MIRNYNPDLWDGTEIILYGGGAEGASIAKRLLECGIDNFLFCDRNMKAMARFLGYRMISPEDLCQHLKSNVIISSGAGFIDIYSNLRRVGYDDSRIFLAINLLSKNIEGVSYSSKVLNGLAKIQHWWNLSHIDVILTERCTLSCKDCISLTSYYKQPRDVEEKTVVQALDRLISSGCFIESITLIGGEPLLNQKLLRIILVKYKACLQIGCFYIYTNGTIIPEQSTITAIKENGRCMVFFSDYGVLSKHQREAMDSLKAYGVFSDEAPGDEWWSYGELMHYQRPPESTKHMFDECYEVQFCKCNALLNGRLYVCNRIAHATNMKIIEESDSNYVDLLAQGMNASNGEELSKKVQGLLARDDYPTGCEYCNINRQKKIPKGIQIGRRATKH